MREWFIGICSIAIALGFTGWLQLSLRPNQVDSSVAAPSNQQSCRRRSSHTLLTISRLKSSLRVETYSIDGVDGPLATPTNLPGRTSSLQIGSPASFPLASMLDDDQIPDVVILTPPVGSDSRIAEVLVVYSSGANRRLSFTLLLRPERPNLLLGDWNGSGVAELGLYYPQTGIWDFYPDFPSEPSTSSELIPSATLLTAPGGFALAGDVAGSCDDQPVLWLPGTEPRFVVYASVNEADTPNGTGLPLATGSPTAAGPAIATGEASLPEPVVVSPKFTVPLGLSGDLPLVADLNCDGRANLTVYRPSSATWYYLDAPEPSNPREIQFGAPEAFPLTADFDGDGCIDLGYYARRSNPPFSIRSSRYSAQAYSLFPNSQTLISTPRWGSARAFPPETWKYITFLSRQSNPESNSP